VNTRPYLGLSVLNCFIMSL